MKLLAVIASVIAISSFSSVYAEPIILEQVSPSGILIKLEWPEVYPDEIYKFKVSFHDPITDELIHTNTRFDYTVLVKQNDYIIEEYYDKTIKGEGEYEVLFPENSQGPAEVTLILHFIRTDDEVLQLDEEITFPVNVVPEFGVITAMILAASLVPILLLSKSKLMPKIQ